MTPEALLTLLAVAVVINVAIMVVLVVALVRRRREPAAPAVHAAASAAAPDASVSVPIEAIEPMTTLDADAQAEVDGDQEAQPEDALDEEGLLSILTDPVTGLDNRLAWDRSAAASGKASSAGSAPHRTPPPRVVDRSNGVWSRYPCATRQGAAAHLDSASALIDRSSFT